MWIACPPTYCHGILIIMNRHGKMGTSGRVGLGWVTSQMGCRSKRIILSGLKTGSGQSGCGSDQVELTRIFHINFFFTKKNMYLPFGKLCNKLLDVKCITLNSPLISRMNSVKLINTYSIILKL